MGATHTNEAAVEAPRVYPWQAYTWEFKANDKWQAYDVAVTYNINQAFREGKKQVEVSKQGHILNFEQMKQFAKDDETRWRAVRRSFPSAAPPPAPAPAQAQAPAHEAMREVCAPGAAPADRAMAEMRDVAASARAQRMKTRVNHQAPPAVAAPLQPLAPALDQAEAPAHKAMRKMCDPAPTDAAMAEMRDLAAHARAQRVKTRVSPQAAPLDRGFEASQHHGGRPSSAAGQPQEGYIDNTVKDLMTQNMTPAEAIHFAATIPGCVGFCYEGSADMSTSTTIFFKGEFKFVPGNFGWYSVKCEGAAPARKALTKVHDPGAAPANRAMTKVRDPGAAPARKALTKVRDPEGAPAHRVMTDMHELAANARAQRARTHVNRQAP